MRVVYRGTTTWVRRLFSFGSSGCLHFSLLAWVILSSMNPLRRAPSMYDQEIRPGEKRIVWYSLREKLPEIEPSDPARDVRPPRARVKAEQTMVSGARDDARPAPLIWAPEPEVTPRKELPLPNVVAVAPKIVRPFVAPPVKAAAPVVTAVLGEAPRAAEELKPRSPAVASLIGPVVPGGPARAFTPPPSVRMQRQAMLPLPEGPTAEIRVDPGALPFAGDGPRPQRRAFVPPPAKGRVAVEAGLPAAPELAIRGAASGGLDRVPRSYVPRGVPAVPAPAPVISAEPPAAQAAPGATAAATLAIVGLNPARTTEVPSPPGSRPAGFSAGPQVREEGGAGAKTGALVNVPGLTVRGGAKDAQPTLMANLSPTSRENLLAARERARESKAAPADASALRAAAPDPRFAGRVVYSIAIQMPNVTSFSGSWLVWFAEREPVPGAAPPAMTPPEVVRKVDPKYIAAAAAERVEGTVRLFGVIRKDGHVGGIVVLRQLDERLDRSAQEALGKWEFVPALRDGVRVDVDAIFEIPFHLAPRPNQ